MHQGIFDAESHGIDKRDRRKFMHNEERREKLRMLLHATSRSNEIIEHHNKVARSVQRQPKNISCLSEQQSKRTSSTYYCVGEDTK